MRNYAKIVCIFVAFICTKVSAQKFGCQAGKNDRILSSIYYSPENHRSDTFDILKYTINLEIGNFTTKNIFGNTQIRFAPKLNNQNYIRFDLLKLLIDSVKENSTLLTYNYNDTILKINFTAPKNITDTSIFSVYYHGLPQGDPSGWGGFYFDNNGGNQYAYNLGVGFGAKPHNYGRVWYPCFDNFVERSKYEYNITCDTTRRAYCNGQLISDVIVSNKRTRKWVLNDEIPSYLASIAVANYTQVNWTINAMNGVKPITLVGVKNDTTGMKNGFVHLKNCINGFENYYGPYYWNRFGYTLVPFNSGAMEHVTSISYPRATIGSLTYEADLMAHELSHHWWGDLVTCETQEDMWINEGMATFSSYMFLEWQYGTAKYLNAVKTEHDVLLQFLHHKEGGFRAISGIPFSLTYGDHVYKKGADVAHTLRGYMGDAAFFTGLKYILQQNKLKSLNSIEFRNYLQTSSGQNLTDFFNNWVLGGGWSHFAVDSIKYNQITPTSFDAVIAIKQKTYGTNVLHNSVPLEIKFFKSDWSAVTRTVTMNGATGTFTVNIPYNPVYSALNYDSKIGDATSHEYKTIKIVTNVNYTLGKVTIRVKNKGLDSSLVRVVHNYVKPDPFKNNPANHKLSNQHYWKVEGILSPGFYAKGGFNYDGSKVLAGSYAYMDTLLTIVNGDSVRLFYRANAADDWKVVKYMTKNITSIKAGYIEVDTLKLGEYAFGNSTDTSSVGLIENVKNNVGVNVYPNPAKHKCTVEFTQELKKEYVLSVYNIEGKILMKRAISTKVTSLDISQFIKGTYFIKIESENVLVYDRKLLID
ncbi:MAG: T9SS type A sorting domain-containing protein [Bacteroidetes bacterium]|nr:T9SS type A sorting domain-containing protein [Bacteroidota bacterium]